MGDAEDEAAVGVLGGLRVTRARKGMLEIGP